MEQEVLSIFGIMILYSYTGVVLLNKVDEMEGGKLEIMHHNKHHALELLAKSHDYKCEAVSYERAGKMILAQGSEILHHVTPVLNDSKRYFLNLPCTLHILYNHKQGPNFE